MPLITCPACKAEISATATRCPKCGQFIQHSDTVNFVWFLFWGFVILSILAGIGKLLGFG